MTNRCAAAGGALQCHLLVKNRTTLTVLLSLSGHSTLSLSDHSAPFLSLPPVFILSSISLSRCCHSPLPVSHSLSHSLSLALSPSSILIYLSPLPCLSHFCPLPLPATSLLLAFRARSVLRMASLGLLVLGAALLQAAQCALAARGGVGRQNLLAYDDDRDEVMSYPAYYRSDGWSGPSLEQALQRLVERGQRRKQDQEEEEEEEEEEQQRRTATVATLLRFLAKAEAAGSVDPGDLQMEGKDFRGRGRGASMGRPPAAWWTLVTPQLLQALLDRMEPRVGGAQPAKTRLERFRGDNYEDLGDDVRHLLARILPIISPDDGPSNRRARRDLSVAEPAGSARRRSRRSLGDDDDAPPSDSEPLLRVKRLGEEEQEGQRLHAVPNANARYGARRRRAALNHVLLHQIVNYMRK